MSAENPREVRCHGIDPVTQQPRYVIEEPDPLYDNGIRSDVVGTEMRLLVTALYALAREVRHLRYAVEANGHELENATESLRGVETTLDNDLLNAGRGR